MCAHLDLAWHRHKLSLRSLLLLFATMGPNASALSMTSVIADTLDV